jgi:hypothetical protein
VTESSEAKSDGPQAVRIQYWVDSASPIPAKGGGIQRIGFDQEKFQVAVDAVIINPVKLSTIKPIIKDEMTKNVVLKKEDITLIVRTDFNISLSLSLISLLSYAPTCTLIHTTSLSYVFICTRCLRWSATVR